jgi:oligopeptide transport system substrate-binding protein
MHNTSIKFKQVIIFSLISVFISCNSEKGLRPAKNGNRFYGGKIVINESKHFEHIFPISVTDIATSHITSQVFEGLVKFDTRNSSIKPALASKWDISDDGLKYTFYLKNGVKFHDDDVFDSKKDREISADDVIFSFEQLCTYTDYNFSFNNTFSGRVKGADEYFEATKNGKKLDKIEGINKIDDQTIEITLNHSSPTFIQLLALPSSYIISKKAFEKHGPKTVIGTGPFIYAKDEKIENNYEVTLTRNNYYHEKDSFGNELPYLDSLVFTDFIGEKDLINNFVNKQLDLVLGLNTSVIKKFVEENIADFKGEKPIYILDSSPENATQYYQLNTVTSVFKDKKVRQAFSYAVDRQFIVNNVLNDEGFSAGFYGITSPTIKGYDVKQINGYNYDPEKARKLLAEAGFKDGKDFPNIKLQVNQEQSKNINVALEFIKQIQNVLKVNVDLEVVPFKVKQNDATLARGDIFKSAWIADYPSPESFLSLFYGKTVPDDISLPSFPNVSRIKNAQFDELFEKGWTASTLKESYDYFIQAENIIMEEAPIIVLWYDERFKLYHGDIKNFVSNPLNNWTFSEVYRIPTEIEQKTQ